MVDTRPLERLLQPQLGDASSAHVFGSNGFVRDPLLLRNGDWHVYATPSASTDSPGGRVIDGFTTRDGRTVQLRVNEDGSLRPPFDLDEAYDNYLAEAWVAAAGQRRLSERQLATFYRLKRFIPRSAQLRARRALIRWQSLPAFPGWPLDSGVGRLVQLYAASLLASHPGKTLSFRWFWPAPYRAALVLTHDVESAQGIRLAVELADLEEELGFRSSFNFGAWYDVDPGILRELTSRGFEVGMHGLVHDGSLFSSRGEFERQLPRLAALADKLGAVGFRSPSTHRQFAWLADLPVEYDCTVPHSDPYEPRPGGCCSLWPFFVGEVVELPYTLPQDHTLLTLLGHRAATLWIDTARAIEERFGLIQCVSHPDPGYLGDAAKRATYAAFLRAMAERENVWRALPREVADWWRLRARSDVDPRVGLGQIAQGTLGAAQLLPPDASR